MNSKYEDVSSEEAVFGQRHEKHKSIVHTFCYRDYL